MKVAKWGHSVAVRVPAAVVEALRLKEGDEIEIHVAGAREFDVARKPGRQDLLNSCASIEVGCHATLDLTGKKPMPDSFFDTFRDCPMSAELDRLDG